MKIPALKNAIRVSHSKFPEELLDDITWFIFEADHQINTVVQIKMPHPYKVFINSNLIRNYSWNGYLLIALHEWFHLILGHETSNDLGHEIMANSMYDAQLLALAGMENTPIYENMHPIKKLSVEEVMRKYGIKIK